MFQQKFFASFLMAFLATTAGMLFATLASGGRKKKLI
jgi:hypothetical protein